MPCGRRRRRWDCRGTWSRPLTRHQQGSRDAAGLAALVQRSLPAVEAADRRGVPGRSRGNPAGPAHRDRTARPVRPPDHAEPVDGPRHPPTAGDLGTRPATVRQPGRHHRPAAAAAGRPRAVLPPRHRVDRYPRHRPLRRRNTMTATPALTTDLQRQVLLLEDDLRARVAADPDLEGRWKQEHQRAIEQGTHGGVLGRLARRPGHPGGGRVGADQRVHPLLRGQRAGRAGLDRGPGTPPPGSPRRPVGVLPRPPRGHRPRVAPVSDRLPRRACPRPRRWSTRTPRCTWSHRPVTR